MDESDRAEAQEAKAAATPGPTAEAPAPAAPGVVVVGKGIRVKGRVTGAEDLILRGQVEGVVTLRDHRFTIESAATVEGDVDVKHLTVRGEHAGNTVAREQVCLDDGARVLGDVRTPSLIVRDGAKFKGRVEMQFELPAELRLEVKKGRPSP
jgi:cytoskeletal protein CcmA (bactofilin family)